MERAMEGKYIESRIYETPKTYDSVKCLCLEAIRDGLASVQVFPSMIELCKKTLRGSDVCISALISYPHGDFTVEQKLAEAREAAEKGAGAVEVVMNTREVKSGNYDYILNEMKTLREGLPKEITVKFNIEIECLTEEEAKKTAEIAREAGIDYISTSTGLYHALDENRNDVELTASPAEVRLLKEASGGAVKIQSVGYIRTAELAEELIAAGADLISTEYASCVMGE